MSTDKPPKRPKLTRREVREEAEAHGMTPHSYREALRRLYGEKPSRTWVHAAVVLLIAAGGFVTRGMP